MENILKELGSNDKIMKTLIKRLPEYERIKSSTPLNDLIRSIIGQQLSSKAAFTIYNRFINLVGDPIEVNYLYKIELEKLKSIGISNSKCSYIKNVTNKIITNPNYFNSFEILSNEDVIIELTKIKGVGTWTAQMFLMFSLDRLNILPTGDIGIQNAVKKYYQLNSKPTIEQLKQIASCWEPYRTIGCWYMWQALDNRIEL